MGIPAGDWYINDLLTFTVNTHTVTTGAATDADSVPTYRLYEDETGTPILTGSMAKLDDAGTTGFYSEQITLSAANGFEVGKSYAIYTVAVVNSITATQSYNFKVIATPTASLDAAGIRAAVGLASANLDTQIGDLPTNAELATSQAAADDATLAAIAALSIPTATQNATGLLDLAAGVETSLTVRQALRLSASALFGKASGLGTTTAIYRDFGDTKARITATVDADGNRTAITRDAT